MKIEDKIKGAFSHLSTQTLLIYPLRIKTEFWPDLN